jgi:hypothetical protein
VLIGLIAVALWFDFFNGLARRRNSIANIVSARVAMQCSGPQLRRLPWFSGSARGLSSPAPSSGPPCRACAVRWNVASGIVYARAIAIRAAAVVALAY